MQSPLGHGAISIFQGAFWWTTGITFAALILAMALPLDLRRDSNPRRDQIAARKLMICGLRAWFYGGGCLLLLIGKLTDGQGMRSAQAFAGRNPRSTWLTKASPYSCVSGALRTSRRK